MSIAETSSHLLDTIGNNCPNHCSTHSLSGDDAIWNNKANLKETTLEVMDVLIEYLGGKAKEMSTRNPHRRDAAQWRKRYNQTAFCHHTLIHEGDKVMSISCKHRWCGVCNRTRVRKALRAYGTQINELPDPYFVTLTLKNCKGAQLKKTLDKMQATWRSIYKSIRHECGAVYGFKKLEITYNKTTDEYHPHYHIIVSGVRQADLIQSLWMKTLGKQLASQGGQYVAPVKDKDRKKTALEVLKYCYKTYEQGEVIDPKALHTIHLALYRRRTHEPLGIKKAPEVDLEVPATSVTQTDKRTDSPVPVIYVWRIEARTWVNAHGEPWVIRYKEQKRRHGKDTG